MIDLHHMLGFIENTLDFVDCISGSKQSVKYNRCGIANLCIIHINKNYYSPLSERLSEVFGFRTKRSLEYPGMNHSISVQNWHPVALSDREE